MFRFAFFSPSSDASIAFVSCNLSKDAKQVEEGGGTPKEAEADKGEEVTGQAPPPPPSAPLPFAPIGHFLTLNSAFLADWEAGEQNA